MSAAAEAWDRLRDDALALVVDAAWRLQEEADNRELSGLPEYIAPMRDLSDRANDILARRNAHFMRNRWDDGKAEARTGDITQISETYGGKHGS